MKYPTRIIDALINKSVLVKADGYTIAGVLVHVEEGTHRQLGNLILKSPGHDGYAIVRGNLVEGVARQ